MAQLISVRDYNTGGYAVRAVSFRGQPVGPDFAVVNVGKLARMRPQYVDYILGVDLADLVRRFKRDSWVAINRSTGAVAQAEGTKREVCAKILSAHE